MVAASLAVAVLATTVVSATGTAAQAAPPPVIDVPAGAELWPGGLPGGYCGGLTGSFAYQSFADDQRTSEYLFVRSIASEASSVNVGPATFTDVLSYGSSCASDDAGTLAYVRRTDGRLVLRSASGGIEVPAWGAATAFADGPVALDEDWVAAGSFLFSRQTGASYDLLAWLTAKGYASEGISEFYVGGGHALVGTGDGNFIITLGPAGPVGDPVLLPFTGPSVPEGITDGYAVIAVVYGGRPARTDVYAVPLDAPEAYVYREFLGPSVGLRHDWVTAVSLSDASSAVIDEYRLPGLETPVRSVRVDVGSWTFVSGDLMQHSADGAYHLSDLAGRTVVVQGTGVKIPQPFTDVAPTYSFASYISWLAGKGISTGYAQPDGSYQFKPTTAVSREAMAAFLFRDIAPGGYTPPASARFSDVPTSYPFYTNVAWLAQQGISTGYADGTFKPTDAVTREAMAAFLYRAAGSPAYTPPASPRFSDVPTDYPFYKQISWLAAQGISTGYADGTFKPTAPVTREAMAAFLQRADPIFHPVG